jgi:arylsulfatase A-like enzyme
VLFSLLAFEDDREIVEEPSDRPVYQDIMKPRGAGTGVLGPYPAVVVAPPTTLRYRVPPTHPNAVFQYALAVRGDGYGGEGSVVVEGRMNGASLFERRLDCSESVPRKQRKWREYEAPLPEGGTLELSFRYEGDQEVSPQVGIGLMRAAVPFQIPRRRASPREPNVVLVVIDTLRADRLHCYGNEKEVSPVMDALAARGTRFERAYSSAAWTIPSTASVLTGKSPPQHGLGASDSYYLSDTVDTLPEIFQRSGFTTVGFACNPLIARERNFDQGFEFFHGYRWTEAAVITGDIHAWLDEHREQRFFLYIHYVDPHGPYAPEEGTAERFVKGEKPPDFYEHPEEVRGALEEYYAQESTDPRRLVESVRYHFENYDAEIFDVDRGLGRVLERIDELGLTGSTVVCVTSDHGEEFLEHGWFGHHAQLFDESVHVPLLMAGPGIAVGKVVNQPSENRFLAPTLLELARVELPPTMDRGNLLDSGERERLGRRIHMTNSKGVWSEFDSRAFQQLGQFHSVIEGRWRLVFHPGREGVAPVHALFDLETDPACRHDVAIDNPQVVVRLEAEVARWMEEGRKEQPRQVPPAEETARLLRSLGYIGDEE